MRKAKKIEFDTENVPKDLDEVYKRKYEGQYSRAERYMIETRPDLESKTIFIKK
jgi:hypothetical protein